MATAAAAGSRSKLRFAAKAVVSVFVPAIPVLVWWKSASDDRKYRAEEVRTKVRIPNLQTIDDLMVEKCRPGDVLLFDRRPQKCASGPGAALSCLAARAMLCDESDRTRSVDTGMFDHCALVVPGKATTKAESADPSNLMLLEATAGEGIVSRPLLMRLEMSRSRSVLLLPLSSAGERRYDADFDPPERSAQLREKMEKALVDFQNQWTKESETQNYAASHSTLGMFGALGYVLGLQGTSRAPVSPSAWLVVSALQDAGAGQSLTGREAMETRTEDFLRDHRFNETDTVRLRPGWKFL